MTSTYYPPACRSDGVTNGTDASVDDANDLQSSSHEYRDIGVINIAALLAQSGFGNTEIYAVDIDVRDTHDGVSLVRGGGADVLLSGGTRRWTGAVASGNKYRAATDFTLTMKAGDVVVVSWSEIA